MPKIRIVPDRRIMDALIKSGKALSISVLAKCEGRTSDKTVQVPSSHILDYKLGDRYIVSTKKGARTFIVAGMMVSRGDHRDFKNLFFLMKEDRVRAGKD